MHPKGLRRKLREAATIEEAMLTLLIASNEEKKLRAAVRSAATLEVALDILMPENEHQQSHTGQTGTVYHSIDSGTESEVGLTSDIEFESLFEV